MESKYEKNVKLTNTEETKYAKTLNVLIFVSN